MEASGPHSLRLHGPNFPVETLVPRLLLLIGLPLVWGYEHLVTRRTAAAVERLCFLGSVGGTGGRPCLDAGRILGYARVQGLFSTRILGRRWNPLKIGIVIVNFDWLPDHPSEIGCCEVGPEATGWLESWEGPKGLGVKHMWNWLKILACCSVRPLSSPAPPFCWQGMQEGAGEMQEFELTAPGRRMSWSKRRRITGREQAGDAGPGEVGLASRLVGLWTSFVAGASLG
jgi:hypothetical protein